MTTVSPEPRWVYPPDTDASPLLKQAPSAVARVLVRRGIDTPEKLRFFFNPPHRLPHDPLRLAGMDAALQRLYRAVNGQERVGVFGDFDVDGITGAAIIAEGLAGMGVAVTPYLPHRVDEGHGLSEEAIDRLVSQGITLIITVDCGITAYDEVSYAASRGADVIITDHHLPGGRLPPAVAAINPKLPGGEYPFFDLCGAGLAFKLVQGLYEFNGLPWDRGLLELAALGTIADLVPMVDENRYLVTEGIRRMMQTRRPGLRALLASARVPPEDVNSETISFQIGPRLNSAGRMGHPMDSYRLLTTDSDEEAGSLARKLEALNLERRDATEHAFRLACERVEDLEHLPAMLVVADDSIPRGVAGLVAGRLTERYQRPAVVLAVEEEYAVASARSIPGFNVVGAIESTQDLLVRFGGHAQAAGFTLPRRSIDVLASRLDAYAAEFLESPESGPKVEIDAVVELPELTPEVVGWLSDLEPYGQGNRRPMFASQGVAVRDMRYMGHLRQHLRLVVEQQGVEFVALAFNQAKNWDPEVRRLDLAYTVTKDSWQGENAIALRVVHFRPAARA